LIVGAVISGLLIPYITSQWQNHEKELELKTNLVSRISEAVSKILTAAQFTNAELPEVVDYHQAYYEWETTNSAIGSYLRAYFPDASIGEEWDEYANITTSFFRLSANNPLAEKEQLISQIHKYFFSCSDIDWNVLLDPNNLVFHNADYRSNWFLVKDQIIFVKNNISQRVLELPIFIWKPFWQTNIYETKDSITSKLHC
jgi:hypothetical protein